MEKETNIIDITKKLPEIQEEKKIETKNFQTSQMTNPISGKLAHFLHDISDKKFTIKDLFR